MRRPLCLILLSAFPAFAQDDPTWRRLDDCDALPGFMVMTYLQYRAPTVFEYADACLDIEAPALNGSEPLSGLELVQDYGYGTLQYQIVTPGSLNHERSSLSIGPMLSLIDGNDVTVEDAAAVGFQADYSGTPTVLHRGADRVMGEGYAYRALVADAEFPGGTWVLQFTVKIRDRISGAQVLDHTHMGIHAVVAATFDGTETASTELFADAMLMQMPITQSDLTISIKDGIIAAGIEFTFQNTRLPAGRTENEWSTATVSVPDIRGHVTKGATDIQMHGLGIGRMVTSDDTGRQDVDALYLSVMGSRVPDGMDPADYTEGE